MGTIRKRGTSYFIDYYVNGKRIRESISTNRAVVEKVLKKKEVEVIERRYLGVKHIERIKFEDFCQKYLEYSKTNKKPNSSARDTSLTKRLSLSFSGYYLYEITIAMIEDYKTKRKSEVAPATVNRELACLKNMFNKAIEWGYAEENPVRKVKLFKENNARVRFLEKEEIGKLLTACDELTAKDPRYKHLKPAVIVALNTGMRRSEVLNLKWRDIDIRRNLIYLYNTKNGERREVPMNDIVRRTLIAVPKNPNGEYIFCGVDGKAYYNLRKSFFTALKKCGIIDFHFHDLRHTFASHLIMNGVDLMTTKDLLGHKSIEMTLRYSHLSPSHKQRAVELLATRLGTIWAQDGIEQKAGKKPNAVTIDNSIGYDFAPVAQMDRAQVS